MPKIDVYNMQGQKSGIINLNPEIFGIKINPSLLHQAVVTQLANGRSAIANTKTRGYVRGGGRKPWRQKGTGRARAGSTRSPLWIGGGITFGPTKARNYKKKFPKKMRRSAILMSLSARANDKKIIILNELDFTKIKTKQVIELLSKLPVEEGNFLVISSKISKNLKCSFANVSYVKLLSSNSLNVLDILKYDWLILTKSAIENIESVHLRKDKEVGRDLSGSKSDRKVQDQSDNTSQSEINDSAVQKKSKNLKARKVKKAK